MARSTIRRFIPAPAGNSCRSAARRRSAPVHPRACGELPCSPAPRILFFRFIPAPAGNSVLIGGSFFAFPVHPRACGELRPALTSSHWASGSSPRLRGTLQIAAQLRRRPRFIPAPAGNSLAKRRPHHEGPVHPRACGELQCPLSDPRLSGGSSPRLRGTPGDRHRRNRVVRFIPAPAGNSPFSRSTRPVRAVHPRACGELVRHSFSGNPSSGSSPRLRGTQRSKAWPRRMRRFIPAPAGNS